MRSAATCSRWIITPLLVAVCLLIVSSPIIVVAEWTAFQNGGTIAISQRELPLEWSPSDGVAWRKKLAGYGQSSPVAASGVIYVTSTSGDQKQQLHVQAISAGDGKQLWRHDAENSSPEKSSNYISRAAPSPVCDGDGVIALFEGGNVLALTRKGQLRWKRDLAADYGPIKARHGLGSSLAEDDERVFVWIERQKDPYIAALSKKSGETLWKSDGLSVTTWSSPRLVPVNGGHHLVLSGSGKLAGFDPKSGRRLWQFDEISGNSTPTPIPLGKGRFLIGASAGPGGGGGGNAADSNGVIQIEKTASGAFEAKFVWRAKRATSSFGSPVAHQGHAYFVNRAGVVYCLDLETGAERYAERSAGSIWATPIAVAERLYLFGRGGKTTVLKSGSKFERLAVNTLWKDEGGAPAAGGGPGNFGGPVLYAAVVVDKTIVMRRGDVLYAVRK